MKTKIKQADRKKMFGTHFTGLVVKTSVKAIREILGDEVESSNDGQDKTNFDFVFELNYKTVFTMYDWKMYRPIELDEIVEFHVGTKENIDKYDVKLALERLGFDCGFE